MSECPSSEKLSAYLDREVSELQASQIAGHVAACGACAAALAGLRGVGDLLRTANFAAASPELMTRLHLQADEFAWRGPERLAGALAALAACGAIVCAVYFAHRTEAAVVPEKWEQAAVNPAGEDATARDTSLAEWMVAGLSSTGVSRE